MGLAFAPPPLWGCLSAPGSASASPGTLSCLPALVPPLRRDRQQKFTWVPVSTARLRVSAFETLSPQTHTREAWETTPWSPGFPRSLLRGGAEHQTARS
ncbi:hypothetical protein PGTUg99_024800 [Puccinia graminis f. sp. tritici]|uniref:Uncharacterized protein n=1 Tax=Puccinia graminis f. sp. tritici TaxID=56615 RepID=A0A5B0R8N2_PUCGR|nr:hypothetical protein PGTUg99_024800 [Puccinia graminis f. sp. tritici]